MKREISAPQQLLPEERFFVTFFRLLQATKLHSNNNEIVIRVGEEFIKITDKFAQSDNVLTLQITAGRFYLQKEKLRYRKDMANLVSKAIQYFENRQLHGLEFSLPLEDSEKEQLFTLARLFNSSTENEEPAQWLEDEIKEREFTWVKVLPQPLSNQKGAALMASAASVENNGSDEGSLRDRQKSYAAQQSYAHVMSSLKEVVTKITADKPAGMRQTIRVVQNMVDLILDDSFVLLGLSTLRDYDDYTYTHSINVSILAMSLGHNIGLSRESLEMLGICGLFHDLGKVAIPLDILNKPEKLSDPEIEQIHKHTFYSVSQIIKLKVARDIRAKIMLPPFEHHLKYDLSGYPQTNRAKPISLFGRILTITDVYDAITSPRIYRKTTLSQDQALSWMAKRSGSDFDPILIKVFVNMMGLYPPGTLVELDNGEVGLVKSCDSQAPLDRPRIVLLKSTEDGEHLRADEINLNTRSGDNGQYARKIVKGYNPSDYGIQPAQFIL